MNLSSHPAIENKRYSQELKKIHKKYMLRKKTEERNTSIYAKCVLLN